MMRPDRPQLTPTELPPEWDPRWAGELARSALVYIVEQGRKLSKEERERVDLDAYIEPWETRANDAAARRDVEAYREAMRGYARGGVEALRAARRGAA